MNIKTKLLHSKIDVVNAKPNVTPLFQCSSFLSESDFFYTRKSNPNYEELEGIVKDLDQAHFAISVTTGMAALALSLRLLKPGDHLIVGNLIYGCTLKLCKSICEQYGINIDIVDLTNIEEYKSKLKSHTRMVLFETPTNPFLKSIDIATISSIGREYSTDIFIVVDNTWATPFFQNPLSLGADISVYSCTKYFSGHSDVMGGIITCNSADIYDSLKQLRFYTGAILDPHSAWLIRRSMQTFFLRMEGHQKVFADMVEFVKSFQEVQTVYSPVVDGYQLRGYGGILFFELQPEFIDKVNIFVNSLKLFERGTSMACIVSAIAQPFTGSHASLSLKEKEQMGLTKTLLRLCIGFEDLEDLKDDFRMSISSLKNAL